MAEEQSCSIERYQSILRLFDDVFFEYRRAEDSITFFNTGKSLLNESSIPFSRQLERFRAGLPADAEEELLRFADSLQSGEPCFSVLIPANLLYDDDEGSSTLLRGCSLTYSDGSEVTVGLLRLQHQTDTHFDHPLSYDALTGVVTKEDITRLATNLIDDLHAGDTTIAIVDVDYFKHVNDTYGHKYGDEVLQRIAAIMQAEVGDSGVCGRIGGDEFFIIFHNSTSADTLREHLRTIKTLVADAFPGKGPHGDKPISLSIGSASYPADASCYDDLFIVADYCLYLAKAKGRNRYIMYTPGKHATLEQIKAKQSGAASLVNGRDDLPLGDALTQMLFMLRYGKRPQVQDLLREFAERFSLPLAALYIDDVASRTPDGGCSDLASHGLKETPGEAAVMAQPAYRPLFAAGQQAEEAAETGILRDAAICLTPALLVSRRSPIGILTCNNIVHLPQEFHGVTEKLRALDILSFVAIPFTDAAGSEAALVFASLHQTNVWNQQHQMYYRLFTDALASYTLA